MVGNHWQKKCLIYLVLESVLGSNDREESSVDVGVQEDVGGTVAAGQTEKFETKY